MIIDANSLLDIKKGWQIHATLEEYNSVLKSTFIWLAGIKEFRGRIVALVGTFDSGKTWLLNQIEKVSLPSGILEVTRAISLFRSTINENVMYMDTAGLQRVVSR